MRILSIIYVLFFLTYSVHGQRQSVLKTNKDVYGYNLVPQEKVFVHYNTSLLFSGEYFYYRVYCFNAESNVLSNISKVAYLVLLDEDQNTVFEHKIKLENGLGQGDFFVPVSIPSGNYKLVGYTQWMLNETSRFFQADVSIVNPYQGNQGKILSADVPKDSLDNSNTEGLKGNEFKIVDENTKTDLELSTDSKSYGKRSLVKLRLETPELSATEGNYSLSVRKRGIFPKALPVRAKNFSTLYNDGVRSSTKSAGTSVFLPEMRGELIYGKIIAKEASFSVSKQSVGLSIPGKTGDMKVVLTDDTGNFVFNLSNRNDSDEVLIQVLGKDKENFTIQIFEIPEVKTQNLEFYQFKISPSLKDKIVERSVHNQIDNVFYSVKPDTLNALTNAFPFHGTEIETYKLDDYTRFGTVKETIVEVVENVWTKKDENGNEVFAVRGYYPTVKKQQNFLPLLVVDGVFIQDQESIINYDARKIKSISFIRDRYYLGAQVFEGLVIIETMTGDYLNSINNSATITLSSLQVSKKYFRQNYNDDESYKRIPDFRNQLLWQPNVKMTKGKSSIEFYTSDVTGDFEICLEGFKDNGFPISIKKYITVE
ncbi:hypothetical protein [uncultured Aquimarina sp.]|uniref:hypothetical protein n=1 Tax=uncultured Aquimarina sp. TaxID=575652 RepID=UPI00262DB5F9|nr:hypothetical protein [uncultured Aquimarina sp.]